MAVSGTDDVALFFQSIQCLSRGIFFNVCELKLFAKFIKDVKIVAAVDSICWKKTSTVTFVDISHDI